MLLRPINEYTTWNLACISCWGDSCDPQDLSFNGCEDYLEEIEARNISHDQFIEMRALARRGVVWLSSVDLGNIDSDIISNPTKVVCMDASDIWMGAEYAYKHGKISENEAEAIKQILINYHDEPRFVDSEPLYEDYGDYPSLADKPWWKFW